MRDVDFLVTHSLASNMVRFVRSWLLIQLWVCRALLPASVGNLRKGLGCTMIADMDK